MLLSKLSHRITFYVVSITLTITFLFGLASFWFTKTNIAEQIRLSVGHNAEAFQTPVETILSDLDHDLNIMSKNLLVVNALIDSSGRDIYIGPFLKGYKTNPDIELQLTLLDFEGKLITSNQNPAHEYSDYEELVATTVTNGSPYAAIIEKDGINNLLLAYPVFYGGTGLSEGFLAMEISLNEIFSQTINVEHITAQKHFLSINDGAEPLFQIGERNADNFYSVTTPLQLTQSLQGLKINLEYGENLAEAMAPLQKVSLVYFVCGVFIFFATMLISLWAAKKIAKPIISLSRVATEVAKTGNPDIQIDPDAPGEVGLLARSFQTMMIRLAESQSTLEQKVEDRSRELQREMVERIRTEKALGMSRAEWENTFDAIPDIITIQDLDMHILLANQATCDFFKMAREEIIGKKCHEIFRGEGEPCPNCPELQTLQDQGTHIETIHHRNLQKIFNVTSCPIIGADNNVRNLVHIARDITDIKKLEENFMQAQKMEAIGTLAGGIAHDFNNILSAIMGYSEIIELEAGKESGLRENIKEVLKAGNRAKELVKQILTFSRKNEHSLQPMLPHPIIKEAMKMLRSSIPTTIAIEEKINPECGPIMADPTQIHQIIVNLCTNALHAMEDKQGTLSVSLDWKEVPSEEISDPEISPGPFVILVVKDTGRGIDKKNIDRIFDPYFTTKEQGKGTGLGLAVIHGIVKEYKGFIYLESEPGNGSTFKIYIPALQKEPGSFAEKGQAALIVGGCESILVVDDEKAIASLVKAQLEQLGYRVSTSSDSKKALEMFKASPEQFDLIITDLTMPDLTGPELAKEILKVRPDIPIILCTGYGSSSSREAILATGIWRILPKPVGREDLAINVRAALDGE